MKKIVTLILLLTITFGLNVTNPGKNEFTNFASAQIKNRYPDLDFSAKLNGSGLERMIAGFGNMMITNFLNEATTRKDYLVFSIYDLDMQTVRDFGIEAKNIKVLGVAGNFLPINNQ